MPFIYVILHTMIRSPSTELPYGLHRIHHFWQEVKQGNDLVAMEDYVLLDFMMWQEDFQRGCDTEDLQLRMQLALLAPDAVHQLCDVVERNLADAAVEED